MSRVDAIELLRDALEIEHKACPDLPIDLLAEVDRLGAQRAIEETIACIMEGRGLLKPHSTR